MHTKQFLACFVCSFGGVRCTYGVLAVCTICHLQTGAKQVPIFLGFEKWGEDAAPRQVTQVGQFALHLRGWGGMLSPCNPKLGGGCTDISPARGEASKVHSYGRYAVMYTIDGTCLVKLNVRRTKLKRL